MAELFIKQANVYSQSRPTYPTKLYEFITSKIPCRDLVWDVGTGSGQAIPPLAELFNRVIGTDTSVTQLEHAPTFPNVHYQQTPSKMTITELECHVAAESTVDLVTVAQAMHWFDLPTFYKQVRHVLKKPDGVIAAWCSPLPEISGAVDAVLTQFYGVNCAPFWEKPRELVDDEYRGIDFPFELVEGLDSTGPFKFWAEKEVGLDWLMQLIRSWSGYNTAKEKGVELLDQEMVEKFQRAWGEDGIGVKVAKFSIFLKIGRVGNCN